MHMRDSEVVAAIVAGDPGGLAAAYDRYADPLFKYCRTLLRDPADAADAVQDTFVIAATRLGGLRDPERLQSWLYAVARNECLRIVRARRGVSVLDEALDVTDDSADISAEAERADLRALFEDAKAGLNPGEREVIELQLRAGLEAGEVADVLGVSRNHAHTLLSRAREQLETCLGVLLVGRSGRDQCGELGAMLNGWDGRLTVLLRKRLHRHIEHCGTCTATQEYQLRPSMLLDLSPGAALAAGAALSFRGAAGAPEGLRGHTIALATGHGPAAAAHSAAVLSRAGGFTKAGFPKPGADAVLAGQRGTAIAGRHSAGGPRTGFMKRGLRSSSRSHAAVAAAVVIAVAVAAAAFALAGNGQRFTPAADPNRPAASVLSPASQPATAGAARQSPSATSSTGRPTPASSKPAPVKSSASPPAKTSSPPVSTPPSGSPSRSPSPTPTRTPRGTLSASPAGGTQSRPEPLMIAPGGPGTPIRLSASGGTVSWSVTIAGDPDGLVSVSPASGTLTAGSPVATVTVTVSQFLFCGRGPGSPGECPTITLTPGGAVYSIWTVSGPRHHDTNPASAAVLITPTPIDPAETRSTT
jgi:RNA polymerase sigma factor (sigma-70 family)